MSHSKLLAMCKAKKTQLMIAAAENPIAMIMVIPFFTSVLLVLAVDVTC
jgi:hypothetical protein